MSKKARWRTKSRSIDQNPEIRPPRCPAAEVQGGIHLNAIFPSPGSGIQLLVPTPTNASWGDEALVYWGSENNLVGVLPINPDVGHANPITVSGAMARLFTPENTRNRAVKVWYIVQLSEFGDDFESQPLYLDMDFQPPGGLVPPEHQASVNPALRRIPELDQPIPPDRALTLHIPDWNFMESGDKLYLRWGSHIIGPTTIQPGQVGSPVPVTVPWDIVSGIDGGRAIVDYYIVDPIGNNSRYSTGQQVMNLPRPRIPEANGQFLDGGLASARLRVPEEATLLPGDTVEGFFANQSLGTQPATPGAAMIFTIPGSLIAPNQGNVVDGYYRVLRDGATHMSATVSVAVIPVVAPDLPLPCVPESTDGQLNGSLPQATVRVRATAPLQTGDTVEAFFAGKSLGSRPATPQQDMDFIIPGADIAANQGNRVAALYTVRRGVATYTSPSLPLSVTRPGTPEWDLEYNFDNDRIRYVNPGPSIRFPETGTLVMTMDFDPDWTVPLTEELGVERYVFPETADFRGNVLYIGNPRGVSHNNTFFVDFAENWDVVRFAVTSVHRTVTISFKDAQLNVISPIITVGGPADKQSEVRYDDQGRRRIRHLEIRAVDVVRFDSFKFRR